MIEGMGPSPAPARQGVCSIDTHPDINVWSSPGNQTSGDLDHLLSRHVQLEQAVEVEGYVSRDNMGCHPRVFDDWWVNLKDRKQRTAYPYA
jgi:hypothetical protein